MSPYLLAAALKECLTAWVYDLVEIPGIAPE